MKEKINVVEEGVTGLGSVLPKLASDWLWLLAI